MTKRLCALLIALALLVGMLPASVFAADPKSTKATYYAAYSDAVDVDGNAAEPHWVTDGKLTSGTNTAGFGVLWNKDYLYLAVEPTAGAAEIKVTVGQTTATVTSRV